MSFIRKIAAVFGGTGFVGRRVVAELAREGYTVKVVTRVPESAFFLRPAGVVGQVVPFACDYSNPVSIGNAVHGADVVVNCIGILHERRKGDFKKTHVDLPGVIAAACAYEKVKRFVHVSALGVDKGVSQYAKTKLEGEKAVFENFQAATILRPSIIFGPEDNFFNRFARLAQIMPALPLIGGGHTKFQPVYAGDVANAVMAVIKNPATAGYVFELGGPEVVSFKDIYARLFRYAGLTRRLVNTSFCVAKMQASVLGLLPNPALTRDQVESLKTDSIIGGGGLPGFAELGIVPTVMDAILPTYLGQYRPGGRFALNLAA